MKKVLFAILFVFTAAVAALAQEPAATPAPATPPSSEYQDKDKDKKPIAVSELPATITASLQGQDYTGWTASNAFTTEKDGQTIYIVELKNGSETKKVKFDAQGNKLKDKEKDKDKSVQ